MEKILSAIKNKKIIGIFGDYDVDGASATALLGNFFDHINQPYEIFIPDRIKDGYGPSVDSFNKFINKKIKIIITVDCGTVSFKAIDILLPEYILEYNLVINVDVAASSMGQSVDITPFAPAIKNEFVNPTIPSE